MKNFIVTLGEIALGIFIGATLILGASGLKASAQSSNDHNITTMSQATSW